MAELVFLGGKELVILAVKAHKGVADLKRVMARYERRLHFCDARLVDFLARHDAKTLTRSFKADLLKFWDHVRGVAARLEERRTKGDLSTRWWKHLHEVEGDLADLESWWGMIQPYVMHAPPVIFKVPVKGPTG